MGLLYRARRSPPSGLLPIHNSLPLSSRTATTAPYTVLLCLLDACAGTPRSNAIAGVQIVRPEQVQRPARAARKPVTHLLTAARRVVRPTRPQIVRAAPVRARAPVRAPATTAPTVAAPGEAQASAAAAQATRMDEARANILPRAGANAYDLGHAAIDALPQGTNAPLD